VNLDRINWLNVALMILACAAALATPFKVFLLAYAVLGPLHYLTEISWLHDRKYFAPRLALRRGWLVLVSAAMAAVIVGYVGSEILHHQISPILEMSLVILAFIAAGVAVFATYRVSALALISVGAAGVAAFATDPRFAIAAYLLITMVHVLLFTGCFILFGAMKSRSASGFVSVAVYCGCVAATMVVLSSTPAGQTIRTNYAAFEQLNHVLLSLAGYARAPLYGEAGRRVMQLIAFAYTYHYLNWFSKTSVIRWHEVSKRRAFTIVAIWAVSVALYTYSYRVGFAVLYVLSILHVLLEFPLDHSTIVGLARTLRVFPPRRVAVAG
jgi:hypothetical protein